MENNMLTFSPNSTFSGFAYTLRDLDLSGQDMGEIQMQEVGSLRNLRTVSLPPIKSPGHVNQLLLFFQAFTCDLCHKKTQIQFEITNFFCSQIIDFTDQVSRFSTGPRGASDRERRFKDNRQTLLCPYTQCLLHGLVQQQNWKNWRWCLQRCWQCPTHSDTVKCTPFYETASPRLPKVDVWNFWDVNNSLEMFFFFFQFNRTKNFGSQQQSFKRDTRGYLPQNGKFGTFIFTGNFITSSELW